MYKLKRFYAVIAVLVIIPILLASCSSGNSTGSSQQTAQANSQEAATSAPDTQKAPSDGTRTEQVFDSKKYSDKFSIWFFYMNANTKTGDSILLRSPDGATMLIDAGVPECGDTVLQNIKKLGIQKLDYVTVTHMHVDHIGGLSRVLNNIPAGKLLASNYYDYKSKEAIDLKNTLKEKNISTQFVKEGDTFQLGSEIKVEVLNPQESDGVIVQADNIAFLNNRSVVYKMTYKNNTFLFSGDIFLETEGRLVKEYDKKLDVDFLKIPHHGDTTSSGSDFVNAVTPKVSVITNNNLESINVYNKYKLAGSKVYITAMDNNVLVTSDGTNIDVITEKDRTGSLKP